MPIFVRNNGVWRDVVKPQERAAGVWRWASQFYNRTAAAWQTVYDDPTPPPQPTPILPLVDTNLQNTAENPQAGQINSLINTTYATVWNNTSAFEDGTGAGRGFVNSNSDNVGWSLSNNPPAIPQGPFSIYFECRYRGFGVSDSNRYGFILRLIETGGEDSFNFAGILNEESTTVNLVFQDLSNDFFDPIEITIPKNGSTGWEGGFPIRHLIRFNGSSISVEIEINGTTYTGQTNSDSFSLLDPDNIFPGSSSYQWYRFMVFDEAITDSYYNAEIRGKRNDF